MYRSLKGITTHAVAVVAATLTLSSAVLAQRTTASKPAAKPAASVAKAAPRTNKWAFGAHTIAAPGVSVTGADIEGSFGTGMGGGLGIMLGYDLNRAVTAFASLDVARQPSGENYMSGSFGLVHAELGVRANLTNSNPQMVPYAMAALGRRALGARVTDLEDGEVYDMSLSGTMLSFGGGLQYKVSPKVMLDGGVELGLGAFNHVDDNGDLYNIQVNSSSSIRVRAGVVWRP